MAKNRSAGPATSGKSKNTLRQYATIYGNTCAKDGGRGRPGDAEGPSFPEVSHGGAFSLSRRLVRITCAVCAIGRFDACLPIRGLANRGPLTGRDTKVLRQTTYA